MNRKDTDKPTCARISDVILKGSSNLVMYNRKHRVKAFGKLVSDDVDMPLIGGNLTPEGVFSLKQLSRHPFNGGQVIR